MNTHDVLYKKVSSLLDAAGVVLVIFLVAFFSFLSYYYSLAFFPFVPLVIWGAYMQTLNGRRDVDSYLKKERRIKTQEEAELAAYEQRSSAEKVLSEEELDAQINLLSAEEIWMEKFEADVRSAPKNKTMYRSIRNEIKEYQGK